MPDDVLRWHAECRVVKFAPATVLDMIRHVGREPVGHEIADLMHRGVFTPDDIHHEIGNLLTTAGLNRLTSLFEGAGGAVFNNADAIVGVGSSTTAAAVGDTALGGNGSTTSAYYQGADVGYPTQSGGVINCNATFATGNANFAWNEWMLGIATGTITPGGTFASVGTSPLMFNHKVASLGTKASGAIWTLQATCTIS
ncbi:hypothetical protein ACIA5H_37585 [Nocardia sp. NPDC051900]|uniref:hypothetical protein n=1 Tax=Nocardia sp. NPDC051900 TaxID=3364326 RepID=UPI0037A65812